MPCPRPAPAGRVRRYDAPLLLHAGASCRRTLLGWFLPPAEPGTVRPMPGRTTSRLVGPARRLTPGLYAVGATLVAGLRWRLYDSAPVAAVPEAWSPAWNADKPLRLQLFPRADPIARVGHSSLVYRVTPRDVRGSRGGGRPEDGSGGASPLRGSSRRRVGPSGI